MTQTRDDTFEIAATLGRQTKDSSLSPAGPRQATSNFENSFSKYGGYVGFAAMFAFPGTGVLGNFIVGAVCAGGGAALGMAVGSFFDQVSTQALDCDSLPSKMGLTVVALILSIIGLIAWLIPVVGLPITITGFLLGRKASPSPQRALALTAMGLSLVGLLLSCGNGYLGAMMMVRAGIAANQ